MLKRLLNLKSVLCICLGLFLSTGVYADSEATLFVDHTRLVSQQVDLLKTRLTQATNQLYVLAHRPDNQLSYDQVNTQLLKQIGLDIAVAQSNLDSLNIELTESQQTISRIEKHIQDLENQLNILNIFGLKIIHASAAPNIGALQTELTYQKNLLSLEKSRSDYLQKLQQTAEYALQMQKAKYRRVTGVLKSYTITRLKEQQEQSEVNFQRQQTYWLQQLNDLTNQLNHVETSKNIDKSSVEKLESEIFFANENVNFTYLQMLIARYRDQVRQYKVSIARSTSVDLLNKVGEQTQLLIKQLDRVNDLLKDRVSILDKRKVFLSQNAATIQKNEAALGGLAALQTQYTTALTSVSILNLQLIELRATTTAALQHELSSRQGLPGYGLNAWLDLGKQLFWVPTLTYQVTKSLVNAVYQTVNVMSIQWIIFLALFEFVFIGAIYLLHRYLVRTVSGMADHELGHINLKWLGIKLLHRNLLDVAVIASIYGLLTLSGIPQQNFMFLIYFGLIWIFFKVIMTAGWLVLVESVHDSAGVDVRLYRNLRWVVGIGGVITTLCVFLYQLPIIYEVQDLFTRVFLLYVLVVSVFYLRAWNIVPDLILPYIDDRRTYLKRVVRLLGLVIPLILLTNSAIGLFGYVNLVFTISWYESVFLLILVGYLIVRGLLAEVMERVSYAVIRHVTNGWLWTEAFLKPLDKVLRIALFLFAWSLLFISYGWDQQSPVVERMNKLLRYHLADVLNTTITPLNVLEVLVVISLLFWAARWTREFVYRFLMSRTKDLGLRNSIAILSQYTMVALGILICLRVLGIDFRALAVVAGAFFFGVGLGLRDLFNNFACGFILLIERPIRVGDIVTINNQEGDVIHIGSRAVTIRNWDHMEFVVPNAEIFSKSFINWTAKDNTVRTVFSIQVSRSDNPLEIQKLIHVVLFAHKDILKDPTPEVYLKEMTDDVEFEIRYYVNIRQIKSRMSVRSDVLTAVWEMFERHNIKPPYQQREIVVRNEPPLTPQL
jgi:potassium efflux system protein